MRMKSCARHCTAVQARRLSDNVPILQQTRQCVVLQIGEQPLTQARAGCRPRLRRFAVPGEFGAQRAERREVPRRGSSGDQGFPPHRHPVR